MYMGKFEIFYVSKLSPFYSAPANNLGSGQMCNKEVLNHKQNLLTSDVNFVNFFSFDLIKDATMLMLNTNNG